MLVLVSGSETWGLVVNEAINHGLALVLSPQVGCGPDLLDGNGLYLHEISSEQIARALSEIAKNLPAYRARSLNIAEETTIERQAAKFLTVISG